MGKEKHLSKSDGLKEGEVRFWTCRTVILTINLKYFLLEIFLE